MSDSRISQRVPLRILCQHEHGSCAACCGLDNFRDRSEGAQQRRLRRRTTHVRAAWPDLDRLRAVRDQLLEAEKPDILFAGVKVCPFAGYLVEPGGPVGCLLHPSRHPAGADLRELAVYPREVCAGHFCASHDWLRPREMDLAQTAVGTLYGRVVTDAGLVKAIGRLLDESLARSFTSADVIAGRPPLEKLWRFLLVDWPFVDPDPARFGGFQFSGDDAIERSLPSCLAGCTAAHVPAERTVLDAIATRPLDGAAAAEALAALRARLLRVTAAMTAAS